MPVNKRLKKVREDLNMTQNEFATMFHLKQGTYSRYETGNVGVPIALLKVLGLNMHVNLNWLITGKGEMYVNKEDYLSEKSGLDRVLMIKIVEKFETIIRDKNLDVSPHEKGKSLVKLYNYCLNTNISSNDDEQINNAILLII